MPISHMIVYHCIVDHAHLEGGVNKGCTSSKPSLDNHDRDLAFIWTLASTNHLQELLNTYSDTWSTKNKRSQPKNLHFQRKDSGRAYRHGNASMYSNNLLLMGDAIQNYLYIYIYSWMNRAILLYHGIFFHCILKCEQLPSLKLT